MCSAILSTARVIMERPYWKHEEELDETENITPSDVRAHAEMLLSNASFLCFAHGNINQDQVYMHVHMWIHSHTHVCTCTCTCMHVYIHVPGNVHVHVYTCIIYMYIYVSRFAVN